MANNGEGSDEDEPIFDWDVLDPSAASFYNVMLIEWYAVVAYRLSIGQIHTKRFENLIEKAIQLG